MDTNGLITGTPTGAGTFNFDVTVVDGSTPQQSDTRSLEISIFDAAGITAASPLTDAIVGRTYTNNLDVTGEALGIFWTELGLGAGACSGLSLSSTGILSGTPTTSGLCQFEAIINDANGEVTRTKLDLNVRAEFSVTPFVLVDAIVNRAYANTFLIATNLSNNPNEAGEGAELGNGPISSCSVTSSSAEVVVAGFTCNPTDISVTLAGTPTTTTGILITASVTDSDILQNSDVIVPQNTRAHAFTITVRSEFIVGPITNPVDAVESRTYTNSVDVPTDLVDNGTADVGQAAESGNGPATACVVLDTTGAPVTLTNSDGSSTGSLVRGLTVTCEGFVGAAVNPGTGVGSPTAVVKFAGTATTGTAETRTLTVRIFDSVIQQGGSTVVDIPGNAGNLLISAAFSLSFRDESTITSAAPTPTDAVETAAYSFTFSVTTDLLNSGTEVGQTTEPGNGPILPTPGSPIGCEITQADDSLLPADFSSSYVLTNPGAITGAGCDVTISSAGVADRATNPFTLSLKLTVRDTPIGSATPSGALTQTFDLIIQSATLDFTVRTVDPGSQNTCTGGSFVDGTDGPDAVTGSTYGDPGGGAADGPPNCDLLFEVTGGKTSFTWDTSLGAPPTGISCTQDGASGGGSRRFRCNSGAAAVTGSTSTLTVRATDGTAPAQGGPFVGSTSRVINVRNALAISVSPDPGTNDPVNGRHFGDINDTCASGNCAPVVYSASEGLVPRTFTLNGSSTFPSTPATTPGNGFPDPITCDITAAGDLATPTTLQCDSGAANVSAGAGSYTANVSVDCANDTTPCATQSANRTVELRDALTVVSDNGNPLPPAVQGEPYGEGTGTPVTFTASDGLSSLGVTFSTTTGLLTAGAGFPDEIACTPSTNVFSCNTSAGTITAALGTYTPTVDVDDTANATTPAGADSVTVDQGLEVVAPMSPFTLITANPFPLTTACTGGAFDDSASGGTAPDAAKNRTYGDPGGGSAAPPDCDLLFQVTNGRPPYTWNTSITAPAPISCSQEGANNEFFRCNSGGAVVTGSTSALGVDVSDNGSTALAAINVATDDQGHSDHTIAVQDALAITSISPLNSAIDGSAYNNVLAGTGGLSPQAWSAPQGDATPTLNTGDTDCTNLDLASDGTLSGTAGINDDAICTFNANLDDTQNDTTPSGSDSSTFDIPISASNVPIITNDTLVNGLAGFAYTQQFEATSVAGAAEWVEPGVTSSGGLCPVPGGALPTGTVTLGASSGLLDGTSSTASTFTFGICVEDNTGFELKNFTVVINDALAYTANSGTDDVSPIDTANNTVGTSIAVGSTPRQIGLLPDGTRAYVTNQNSDSVSVIDTTSNTVATAIGSVGNPIGITASPDGTRTYFVDNSGDAVGVIDTSTNTVVDVIDAVDGFTGTSPLGIDITPNGAELYVSNSTSSNAHVISTASNTVTATITVGTSPEGVVASPDGRFVFVANSGSDNVSVIDTVAKTSPAPSISLAASSAPVGLDITPDGRKLYVTSCGTDSVDVIDTAASSVTATVSLTASSCPIDVAITPDGAFAYVTRNGDDSFSVIDTSTDTEIGASPFASLPAGAFADGISMIPYPVLRITTAALLGATESVPYSDAVVAKGGTGTLTWSDQSAALGSGTCTGLALDTTTGVISGTPAPVPAAPGTCGPFTVRVTDAATPAQFVEASFSIAVSP
jgi:YVTN family beta-propeller protein